MSASIWLKQKTSKVYKSIAFIPFLVVLFFLLLSVSMIYLDYSDTGKDLKAATNWIRLKDPSTARTIVSVIAAGLISLTVFSFSMVMVVLNQAASQLSNRVLDKLVGNRFHQFIIGFYIGDIIYALLLLTSIRDVESGIYVPALSTYLLILLSVFAIFLFVLFLHFITQTIKYTTIIRRIYKQTLVSMKESCFLETEPDIAPAQQGHPVYSDRAGVFETFDRQQMAKLARKNNCVITFRYPTGHFVLENVPIADVYCLKETVTKELESHILSNISLVDEPSVDIYFYSGFRQLSEIAIKALSPGINDPGTAAESLRALFALLAYRYKHFPDNNIRDKHGTVRVVTKEMSFDEIFQRYIVPVWDYGKDDRNIRNQMIDLLLQLQYIGKSATTQKFLAQIQRKPFREDEYPA
ncbi:DUF2254 domain-containing protein [Adhaeribacter soli]|uniref:DUF2254 domain-containing protein n=1 Tax=Adhaeribacter soli TaxID=2607655 RepID=UPI00177F777C|nr:DUF2254 domain-containing protein [Adhaeribacter soli]